MNEKLRCPFCGNIRGNKSNSKYPFLILELGEVKPSNSGEIEKSGKRYTFEIKKNNKYNLKFIKNNGQMFFKILSSRYKNGKGARTFRKVYSDRSSSRDYWRNKSNYSYRGLFIRPVKCDKCKRCFYIIHNVYKYLLGNSPKKIIGINDKDFSTDYIVNSCPNFNYIHDFEIWRKYNEKHCNTEYYRGNVPQFPENIIIDYENACKSFYIDPSISLILSRRIIEKIMGDTFKFSWMGTLSNCIKTIITVLDINTQKEYIIKDNKFIKKHKDDSTKSIKYKKMLLLKKEAENKLYNNTKENDKNGVFTKYSYYNDLLIRIKGFYFGPKKLNDNVKKIYDIYKNVKCHLKNIDLNKNVTVKDELKKCYKVLYKMIGDNNINMPTAQKMNLIRRIGNGNVHNILTNISRDTRLTNSVKDRAHANLIVFSNPEEMGSIFNYMIQGYKKDSNKLCSEYSNVKNVDNIYKKKNVSKKEKTEDINKIKDRSDDTTIIDIDRYIKLREDIWKLKNIINEYRDSNGKKYSYGIPHILKQVYGRPYLKNRRYRHHMADRASNELINRNN